MIHDDKSPDTLKEINQLFATVDSLIAQGEYDQVLEFVRKIDAIGFEHDVPRLNLAGFYIDIGSAKSNKELIHKGIALAKSIEGNITPDNPQRINAAYIVGNGLCALLQIERRSNPGSFKLDDPLMQEAKAAYRNTVHLGVRFGKLKPDYFVNYANLLNQRGRTLETFEEHYKAFQLDPHFPMARANMAEALMGYAHVVGGKLGFTLLAEAYQELKAAVASGMEAGPREYFSTELKHYESIYGEDLNVEDVRCSSELQKTGDEFRDFYRSFACEERLYLNPFNLNHRCEEALYDSFVLNIKEDVEQEEMRFLRFVHYVNDIKATYVTARMLMIQSAFHHPNMAFISEDVVLNLAPGAALYSLNLDLAKVAYRTALSVLDKIAYTLNAYLDLGYDSKMLYFHDLAMIGKPTEKKGRHKNRVSIETTNDPMFAALIDLAADFMVDHFGQLKKLRNAFEHRFQRIADDTILDAEEDKVTEELMMTALGNLSDKDADNRIFTASAFIEQLLDLVRLTRSAVIYLICMINMNEARRPSAPEPEESPSQ